MRGLPFALALAACASAIAAPRPEQRHSSWSELAVPDQAAAGSDGAPDGLSREFETASTADDIRSSAHAAALVADPSLSGSAGQRLQSAGAERSWHVEEQLHMALESLGAERAQRLRAAAALHDRTTPSMADLVVPFGYMLEEHTVCTGDGYQLGLFRIPHGAAALNSTERRPAVLLQHGLLQSSAVWVDNGPDEALAFILANAGFDVWLGNSRGNTWSRAHGTLSADDPRFWNFSWDDMAAFDLPATVDAVLRLTGHSRIGFVGHSQGTTTLLAALSSQPELQERLSVAVLLAPVAFAQHVTSRTVLALADMQTDQLVNALGATEFLPAQRSSSDTFGRLCAAAPAACVDILDAICGADDANFNLTRLPEYFVNTPAGTSVKTIIHWAQAVRSPRPWFRWFDYGVWCLDWRLRTQACNQWKYGRLVPPSYDLRSIRVPMALISGECDTMSTASDMALLAAALPPATVVYRQVEPTFAHLDFTWGTTARWRVYPPVMRLLRRFS